MFKKLKITFSIKLKLTMKIICIAVVMLFAACNNAEQTQTSKVISNPIEGTWKLISGTTIEKNDTVVTDYTTNKSFIKIINATHFAFMGHDLNKGKGKDSAAFFSSGGGKYELKDSAYTEHLEYCNAREWEGNDFSFTITINNDTLTQQGLEKIDSIGVNRINIEKYIRMQ
jgi:uncharacterized lipoprotein YehR (DUF1307 family)